MHPAPTGRAATAILPSPSSPSPRLRWSALLQDRHLLPDPELRLRALAALWVAAAALGTPRRPVRQAMREAAEQLVARRPSLRGLWPLLEARLAEPPSPALPDIIAAMVAPPSASGHTAGLIPTLLELGLVDAARAQVYSLPADSPRQRAYRTRMARLTQTGILGWGADRRFIAAPQSVALFPPSLPAFVRCATDLLAGGSDTSARSRAEALLMRLSAADQQAGRAHWVLVRWRLDGPAGALAELAGIRYRSHRADAGLRLLEAALLAEDRDTAERAAALLPMQGQSRAEADRLLSIPLAEVEDALRHPTPTPLPEASVRRTLAVLRGERPQLSTTLAWAQRHLRTPAVLQRVLAALAERGEVRDQLPWLLERLGEGAVERLWCEHVTTQALQLAVTPLTPQPAEVPREEAARALYDEDLALQEAGWARRRVLARACRAVLLAGGPTWPVRLRTLGHLGGDVASGTLCELAARASAPIAHAAADLLVRVDPRRARVWLAAHADRLAPDALAPLLAGLALAQQVPANLSLAWASLWWSARELLGAEQGAAFCATILSTWRAHAGGLPSVAALLGTRAELHADPAGAQDGQVFVRALASLRETLALSPPLLAARLAESPVLRSRLRWSHPERLPLGWQPWSDEDLTAVLRRVPDVGEVAPRLVRPVLRTLRASPEQRAALEADLVAGQWPTALPSSWSLGSSHRLQVLDKRRDLLTWLRFADAAPCCWRSAQLSATVRARLLSVWKDPLSFCFHVERCHGSARWSVGFVFGCLGRVEAPAPDEGVVALLNGVYLQRQQGPLRDQVLSAIEGHMATLGVRWVAVASQYGGMGPVPDRYRRADRTVQRVRALTVHGCPVPFASDDISVPTNATLRLRHLFWTEVPVSECKHGVSSPLLRGGAD